MRNENKWLMPLLALALLFTLLSVPAQAEERSIFVGDLIEMRVSAHGWSEEDIVEKFKAFEIVKLEEEDGAYLLTLRSFEVGVKRITLGNKEVVIDIKSTLDEIERDGIFEGEQRLLEAGFFVHWQYVISAIVVVFLLSGGFCLFRRLKRKKPMILSPIQHFYNQMNQASVEDPQYLVKLTAYFKQYIESTYSYKMRGKTSAELIAELSREPSLQEHLMELKSWLDESNCLKFSGINGTEDENRLLHGRLVDLVRKIAGQKEIEA